MRPTRRYWAVLSMAVLLALAAAAFGQPALLAGTAALGGWLVASAFSFFRTATAVDDQLELEMEFSETHTLVDEGVEITLRGNEIDIPGTASARLRLPAGLSTTASDVETAIQLVDSLSAETTATVETPIAGRFELPKPEIRVVDSKGLFTQTFDRGPTPALTVEPRYPRDLTIGAGDREFSTIGGHHSGEERGQGIEPAEIRKYIPGETADNIDWNATARLGETYVRDFETESALETAFILDARSTTRTGPEGEREFDYLREVALGLLALFRSYEDPVGLVVVDDDGLSFIQQPTNTPGGYDRIRRRLHTLHPDATTRDPHRRLDSGASVADRLPTAGNDESTFLDVLSACVDQRRPLPADLSPLRTAARTLGADTEARMIVFTDDTNRREIRELANEARNTVRSATLFLAPTVLYEPGSLADLPAAYERYSEFERFRRDVDGLGNISAFEVAPGDRRDRIRGAKAAKKH